MKKILFAICLFAAITLNAQTPVFDWVKQIGDSSSETGRGIARDASGNLYITGSFIGTDDFDPGPGVYNLTSATSTGTFILKLTNGGNYFWAGAIAGSGHVHAIGLCIDAARNIYYTGQFYASADFKRFRGTSNLSSTNPNTPDVYVVKLNFPSPLPIELLSFNATQNKTAVDITWQTASETNNDYFTVESSKDGNEFEDVVKVQGAGNSTTILSYSFTDVNPNAGISYYRLKQTDFNGDFSYSNTVTVRLNKTESTFTVYNSPSFCKSFLNFHSSIAITCKVLVTDLSGRLLLSENFSVNEGANTLVVNTASLTKGIYVFEVRSEQEQKRAAKIFIN